MTQVLSAFQFFLRDWGDYLVLPAYSGFESNALRHPVCLRCLRDHSPFEPAAFRATFPL